MIILLHSSKTMNTHLPVSTDRDTSRQPLRKPQLLQKAEKLAKYVQTLSPQQLQKTMKISATLAEKTHTLMAQWKAQSTNPSPAIDTFIGDIYSGLQAQTLSPANRDYADKTLFILSGLYGVLRPYDNICPYRLEMEYQFPSSAFHNLYTYWGNSIAQCLPDKGPIINLASNEYAKTVTPFVDQSRVIAPQFLTISPKTKNPTFVAVHAKIARGAFARWLITSRIQNTKQLTQFSSLGYHHNQKLSAPLSPVFVCKTFGGKGLSIKKLHSLHSKL